MADVEMDKRIAEFLADSTESLEAKAIVKWQWGLYGDFYTALFSAIKRADDENIERLALGFPIEIRGFLAWSRGTLAKELRAKGVMD